MLKFVKEKNGFKSYQSERGFKIYYGDKGSIAGDNNINPEEVIYLINGKIRIIIDDKIDEFNFPAEIKIPAKIYHKLEALTDVTFIVFEK